LKERTESFVKQVYFVHEALNTPAYYSRLTL